MIINMNSVEYRANPYPSFKKIRSQMPVFRCPTHGHWVISRYHDVKMLLKNSDDFMSSGISNEPVGDDATFLLYSRGLIGLDKPDHTRLRRLLSSVFSPAAIRHYEVIIRDLCQTLIDKMKTQNSVDFIESFASPLPIIFMAKIIGIDAGKVSDFKNWVSILISWRRQGLTKNVTTEIKKMFDYFTSVIAKKRINPENDLISMLILANENEALITNDEILAMIRLLLVAGTETVTHLMGNAMHVLLAHPEQMKILRDDFAQIPNFIEESLRYDGPVLGLIRRVNSDIKISDIQFSANDRVLALVASANHDELQFSDPERFDISRKVTGHLAFGSGIHHCLGLQLAKLQLRIAFEELFKAFKFFKNVKNPPFDYLNSFFFRGIISLPVELS